MDNQCMLPLCSCDTYSEPLVSVIVPVYNAAPYLPESIPGILAQTYENIEIICVDDGSTDASLSILEEFASRDSRMRILRQKNQYAGAARNAGIDAAKGDYFLFLDADDFFEPRLVETALGQAIRDDAQMCVYRSDVCDVSRRKYVPNEPMARAHYPKAFPFRPADYADYLFSFVRSAPWAKIVRRDLIMGNGIRFGTQRRAEDVPFSYCSAAAAASITYTDAVLVHLRRGHPDHLESSSNPHVLDFAEALLIVKQTLVQKGEFNLYEKSFLNEAVLHCYYNLQNQSTDEGRKRLLTALREQYFPALGISMDAQDRMLSSVEFFALAWLHSEKAEHDQPVWIKLLFLLRCALPQYGIGGLMQDAARLIEKKLAR